MYKGGGGGSCPQRGLWHRGEQGGIGAGSSKVTAGV